MLSFSVDISCNSDEVGVTDGDTLDRKVIHNETDINHLHFSSLPLTKIIVFYSKRYVILRHSIVDVH